MIYRNKDLQKKVFAFTEDFQINIGKEIKLRIALSANETNFDRHFSSFSRLEFILTSLQARISGARLMFSGEKQHFEIALDHLIKLEKKDQQIEFIEAYSEKIYRRTIISVNS
ncbi:MAG: hypothetical protein AB8B53_10040 [Flavobacteriales bacterium]